MSSKEVRSEAEAFFLELHKDVYNMRRSEIIDFAARFASKMVGVLKVEDTIDMLYEWILKSGRPAEDFRYLCSNTSAHNLEECDQQYYYVLEDNFTSHEKVSIMKHLEQMGVTGISDLNATHFYVYSIRKT